MSEDFDPSPRASKRRKTAQYDRHRTVLPKDTTTSDAPSDNGAVEEEEQYMSAEEEHFSTPSKPVSTPRKPNDSAQSRNLKLQNTSEQGSIKAGSTKSSRRVSGRITNGKATYSGLLNKSQEQVKETQEIHIEIVNGIDPTINDTTSKDDVLPLSGDGEQEAARTRSSGRQRKKPARYVEAEPKEIISSTKRSKPKVTEDVEIQSVAQSPVKGILTPSKTQRNGPRKSVVFSQDVDTLGEQFGFRDINAHEKPSPRQPQRQKKKTVDEAASQQEPLGHSHLTDLVPTQESETFDPMIIDDTEPQSPVVPDISEDQLPPLKHLISTTIHEDQQHLIPLKTTVLSRLTCSTFHSKSAPPHLSSQYKTLHNLLTATISSGESNSLLLLGPRGSGKSHLLNISLANLSDDFDSDFFHTVRLSGFFQTDDRLALREIWRQLGREMNIDEEETEDVAGSYADTMASLLSLLSHPDEMQIQADGNANGSVNAIDGYGGLINGTESLNPELLLAQARNDAPGSRKTSKSIVFVLDEFDLFTTHPRQTLLYNLFDIAQSRKAPIAVIGCSTRMDVIECLEKRVKSRFSHRWLLVPGCASFAEWEDCVKDVLAIDVHGKEVLQRTREDEQWVEKWNEHILNHFLKTDQVQKLMKSYFYTTKALPDLFMALYPMVATLDLSSADSAAAVNLSAKSLMDTPLLFQSNTSLSGLSVLPTLPALHFSLLISATRLVTIHSLPAVNFNLVHAHYVELMARSRLQQTAYGSVAVSGHSREWSRETCREAWEELGHWGMMVPVVGQGVEGGTDGIEGEETRMWRCEVSLEEVEWGVREKFGTASGSTSAGPGEILAKWCREV